MTEQPQFDFEKSPHPPFTKGGRGGITDDLTHEERHILSLLQRGRDNALSVPFLASMTGISQVQLRATVRHLITHHGYCIGSSTGGTNKPPGYYFITEENEIETVYNSLRRRGIKILVRAARLKKISIVEVFGQGEINER